MPRHPMLRLAAFAAAMSLAATAVHAQTPDPAQQQSMRALTRFAVAYGAWTWEARAISWTPTSGRPSNGRSTPSSRA